MVEVLDDEGPSEVERLRALVPAGGLLVAQPIMVWVGMGLPSFPDPNLLQLAPSREVAALVLDVAGDRNRRWCFNCAQPIGYTETEGAAYSLCWWPFVIVPAAGGLTVVCLSCFHPF